jgi:hypothetical protein
MKTIRSSINISILLMSGPSQDALTTSCYSNMAMTMMFADKLSSSVERVEVRAN